MLNLETCSDNHEPVAYARGSGRHAAECPACTAAAAADKAACDRNDVERAEWEEEKAKLEARIEELETP